MSGFEKEYETLKISLRPKAECVTCECGEMILSPNHDGWEYICELDECYHTSEEGSEFEEKSEDG